MQEKESTAKSDKQEALQGPFIPKSWDLDCASCDTSHSCIYNSNGSPAKKPMLEQTKPYNYEQVKVILVLWYQSLEININIH